MAKPGHGAQAHSLILKYMVILTLPKKEVEAYPEFGIEEFGMGKFLHQCFYKVGWGSPQLPAMKY